MMPGTVSSFGRARKGCCSYAHQISEARQVQEPKLHEMNLKARSLKSRCQQGQAPSGDSREESFLPLLASGGSSLILAKGHGTFITRNLN
ncbi:uncharacterized protein RBU33_018160 isoform 2-T3 [Hipposideros larvatus]